MLRHSNSRCRCTRLETNCERKSFEQLANPRLHGTGLFYTLCWPFLELISSLVFSSAGWANSI